MKTATETPARDADHRPGPPLISCIMPTRGRPDYVSQSVRYFQRQDYPRLELIVVYDDPADLPAPLPSDPRIRTCRARPGETIGAKRNRACALARGGIVAHWDDDDWYAPDRLSAQAAPLLSGKADVTGLDGTVFFDLLQGHFWECSKDLHHRLFVEDVHGGTLMYRRWVWQERARYPHVSLAEDAAFLSQAVGNGARLARVSNDGHFIYLRHATNSWTFRCGRYPDERGWRRLREVAVPSAERGFYAGRQAAALALPLPERVYLQIVGAVQVEQNLLRGAAEAVQPLLNHRLLQLPEFPPR